MKTLITYALCISLIAIPFHARPEPPPPPKEDMIVLACALLVIGAVVVYGMLQMCKKIPGPPAKPPPPPPPPRPPGTNTNAHPGKASWVMPRLTMPSKDIEPIASWQMTVGSFQTSANATDWVTRVFFTNWLSDTQTVCVLSDSNGPIATNWIDFESGWTNNQQMIHDFGNITALFPNEERKFYRMVELP